MPTLGLSMIVKNESHVIRRCLDNARPLIDYVCIVDTGSDDGTQETIRSWLDDNDVPGEVHCEPWQDFAYNRTFGLKQLREWPSIDYALIQDADDRFEFDEGFNPDVFKAALTADEYEVQIINGGHTFNRLQIVRNALPFEYRGVLHEFIQSPPGASRGKAQGLRIRQSHDGARSMLQDKFVRDAAIFEKALKKERDPFLVSRYTFYLAQSYRDAAEYEKSIAAYLRRADMGFWEQERYVSMLSAGRMMGVPTWTDEDKMAAFLLATSIVPTRGEAWFEAAKVCRLGGRFEAGYRFAKIAESCEPSDGDLFVEGWIYDYGLLDELEVCASWTGREAEALELCEKMLAGGKLPGADFVRVKRNLEALRERAAA